MNSKNEIKTYSLSTTKNFEASFRKLQKVNKVRVFKTIERLEQSRTIQKAKPLVGNLKGLHSLRIGELRMILKIDFENETVLVVDIGHRRKIYD